MEQARHSRVGPAGQRVEVKVERHQLFLLFIIGLVVVALVFATGVMTGKRLNALAAGARPTGDLKAVDKAAEAEKALRAADAPAAPGGTLAQLAATAADTPPKAEKKKDPVPEKPAVKESKEAKAAPEREKPEAAKAPPEKQAKNGKSEGAGPSVKEPPAVEAAAGGEEWCLQIAALPDRNQAVSLAAQMEKKGYRSHIATVQVPDKGTMYRVRVGHFKTKDEAGAFRDEFQKKENRSGFVTPSK
jgi:DedD protein